MCYKIPTNAGMGKYKHTMWYISVESFYNCGH